MYIGILVVGIISLYYLPCGCSFGTNDGGEAIPIPSEWENAISKFGPELKDIELNCKDNGENCKLARALNGLPKLLIDLEKNKNGMVLFCYDVDGFLSWVEKEVEPLLEPEAGLELNRLEQEKLIGHAITISGFGHLLTSEVYARLLECANDHFLYKCSKELEYKYARAIRNQTRKIKNCFHKINKIKAELDNSKGSKQKEVFRFSAKDNFTPEELVGQFVKDIIANTKDVLGAFPHKHNDSSKRTIDDDLGSFAEMLTYGLKNHYNSIVARKNFYELLKYSDIMYGIEKTKLEEVEPSSEDGMAIVKTEDTKATEKTEIQGSRKRKAYIPVKTVKNAKGEKGRWFCISDG